MRKEVVGSRMFYFSRCLLMFAKALCWQKVNERIYFGFIASDLQFSVHVDVYSSCWI